MCRVYHRRFSSVDLSTQIFASSQNCDLSARDSSKRSREQVADRCIMIIRCGRLIDDDDDARRRRRRARALTRNFDALRARARSRSR